MKKISLVFVCVMMLVFSHVAFAAEKTVRIVPDSENTLKVSFTYTAGGNEGTITIIFTLVNLPSI